MSKAIVVRNPNGTIRHMGPDNGMYDPGVPAGCTKAVEENYDALMQQHSAEITARPKLKTLEERIAALEAKGSL